MSRYPAIILAAFFGIAFSGAVQAGEVRMTSPPAPPAVENPATPTTPAVEAPAEATIAAPAAPAPKDPCEAYKVSYDAYTVCQDRMLKIQRMLDARKERETAAKPPVVAPATAPAAAPAESEPKKTEKNPAVGHSTAVAATPEPAKK